MKIPITKTIFDNCEKEKIAKVLESGWVVQGVNVQKFQAMFSSWTGAKYAQATTSCTTALHLGLEAIGIGRGDKVIIPSFTYIASANAVEYTGAQIVFCDINLKTFNIEETKLEEMIKNDSAIKAIMPVNLFGLCANMPFIMELAKKYDLKVIEDSACGFDSWIGDKHSGTFGDVGCFSFHPRKSICTGEGGMLITDNNEINLKVSQLKDHGAGKSDLQRHKERGGSLLPDFTMRGYNYRMTDIQGAIGVCQMQKAKLIMKERRKVANWYYEAFSSITVKSGSESEKKLSYYLIPPYVPEGYIHGYQSFVCLFTGGEDISDFDVVVGSSDKREGIDINDSNRKKIKDKIDRINIKRNEFMKELEKRGIATRQGTHAVHTLSYYKDKYNLKDEDYIISYAADRLSIALPLYSTMTREEFDYVIDNIKQVLSAKG